jgi:signal transduction histidine kinase
MMKDEIDEIKAFLKQLAGGDGADPEVLRAFDEQFSKLIELSRTAGEGTVRIKSIVDDLQTFTRVDDSKLHPVQLANLIESTVHLVKTQYDDVEIVLEMDFNPLLNCFPSKLSQVLMNLTVNACHAVPEENGRITISTIEAEDMVKILVRDNGCGMDEQTRKRIFEPFYTTKAVGTGTGLGMAISFAIIEEHGGTIEVESKVGKGTTIGILLPL